MKSKFAKIIATSLVFATIIIPTLNVSASTFEITPRSRFVDYLNIPDYGADSIPSRLYNDGYNDLTLDVASWYTGSCSTSSAYFDIFVGDVATGNIVDYKTLRLYPKASFQSRFAHTAAGWRYWSFSAQTCGAAMTAITES